MQVKVSQIPVEDAYVHIENGGMHTGLGIVDHEFEDGSHQRFMVMHAGQSHFGVRVDTTVRLVNLNHVQYLIEMLSRAKQIMERDPTFSTNGFTPIPVTVQLIDGLVVEQVYGPGIEVEDQPGTLREVLTAHNFRNPDTGEIVRTEQYDGPEVFRHVKDEEIIGSHDGGGYDEEPTEGHDAGSYGEIPKVLN